MWRSETVRSGITMSDEQETTGQQTGATPGQGTAEATQEQRSEATQAWREVVTELDALGDALGRWLKAAVNDPENKQRLEDLFGRLEGLANDVSGTVKGAVDADVGQSFKEAADKTGEAFKAAGERVSEEVGPRLAGAFKTMGEKLRQAADKMESKADEVVPEASPASGGPTTESGEPDQTD